MRKVDVDAQRTGVGYYADGGGLICEAKRVGDEWYRHGDLTKVPEKVPEDAWIFATIASVSRFVHVPPHCVPWKTNGHVGAIDVGAQKAEAAALGKPEASADLAEEEEERQAMEEKKDQGIVASTVARAKGAMLAELPEAGWRIAARKAIERSPAPVLKALVKTRVITPAMSKGISGFLVTELGSGLYGLGLGTLMTLHPRAAAKPWIGTLASQMRTEGLVRLGSTVLDPLFDAFEGIFSGLLADAGIDIHEPLQLDAPAPPISETVRAQQAEQQKQEAGKT